MSDTALLPHGWRRTYIGAETDERKDRVGAYTDSPTVLSSTKHQGLVPSDDFFRNRTVYSDDLSNYKSVLKSWFAYATNHLAEGSIGLQDKFSSACVSPIYTVFSCGEETDPNYLYRVLKSPELISNYKLYEQASVNRRGAVRYRDFAKIPLTLPPLAEQRRIVEILDTADGIIRASEQLITKLEQVKQGILQDLITAQLGVLYRLGDTARVTVGHVGPTEEFYTSADKGVKFLRTGNITASGISLKNLRYVSEAFHVANRKSSLRVGDVVISRVGDTGTAAIVPELGEANCANMIIVRPASILAPSYLRLLFTSELVTQQVSAFTAGSAQPVLNIRLVQRLKVPIPPLMTQAEITSVVTSNDARRVAEERDLAKLRLIRQGLMDDLLTGRVRVRTSA